MVQAYASLVTWRISRRDITLGKGHDDMASVTAGHHDGPRAITQLSCFIENRIGALRHVVGRFEAEGICICAVSILEAADHGVVRLVVDRPDDAKIVL